MAEASIAVFGSMIGVVIAFAVVTFALRGRGHKSMEMSGAE